MKTWVKTSALGLTAAIILCLAARAQLNSLIQGTLTPAPDSIVQITAEAMGLEPVALADLPRGGTYWWVTSSGAAAPLPFPPMDRIVPIYAIAAGQFLVDDTGGQVAVRALRWNVSQAATTSLTVSAVDRLGNAVADLIEQIQQTQFERTMMMSLGFPSPGEGGGGTNGGDYGNYSTYTIDTNLLWLEITNVSNGWSYLNLHSGTNQFTNNQVFAIWTKTNLLDANWTIEKEVWPSDPNCQPFTMQNSDRPILFFRAQDWTSVDSDSDGIPDWWAWKYFGTINVTATNLDNYFRPLLYDYQHGQDPNQMGFSEVLAWGDNSFGQCTIPLNLTNAVAVAGNGDAYLTITLEYIYVGGVLTLWPSINVNPTGVFSLALKADGGMVAWGDGRYGQTNIPSDLTNIMAIAAGSCHGLALDFNGNVHAWGSWDSAYEFGNNVISNSAMVPGGISNVVAIAAGRNHDVSLRADGKVLSWGYFTNAAWVVVPTNLPPAIAVAAGWNYSAALLNNGTVAIWAGSLSAPTNSITWYVPASLTNAVAIAGGPFDLLVLKADGAIIDLPGTNAMDLGQITNTVSIANGYMPGMALDGSGNAWILNNSITAPNYPLSHLMAIAAGWNHALAIRGGLLTPLIVGQPASRIVAAGTNLTLSVQALSNFTPSYQWQFNGVNLTGATNAALTLANVQPSDAGDYGCVVANDFGAVISSNAVVAVVTPPVITYQSEPTNVICIYGNHVAFAATASAPGQTSGFPLKYYWQLNGTNINGVTNNAYSFNASDDNIGTYTFIASNTAGTASVSWQVALTNAINVTNDVLLIYNSNSTNSVALKDYYLAHRPMIAGANVLGVACDVGEFTTATNCDAQIVMPVLNWLTNNPTKTPQYLILFFDVPTRIYNYDATYYPSVTLRLHNSYPGGNPYVTYINAENLADCKAYIDKIANIGTNYSSGKLVVSASGGGYGNTNYYFEDADGSYPSYPFGLQALQGVTSNGVPLVAVEYVPFTNTTPITQGTNVAGYLTWGANGTWGKRYGQSGTYHTNIFFKGNSSWFLIESIESFNGQRNSGQGSYEKWLSSNAFGGTNYSNTPVGAVTHVEEPYVNNVENSQVYFGLWAAGKNFAICAWNSRRTPFFHAVGDPFVTR